MKFLKSFFNDEGAIVGLCGFEQMKPKYNKKGINKGVSDVFFNPFISQNSFETNLEKNVLLM